MKKLLFAVAMFGCMLTAGAEEATLFYNPDNHAYFGARLGVDISSTGGSNTGVYNNGAGFTVGAVYNMPIYNNLYFEPGLSLFYNTFGQQEFKSVEIEEGMPISYFLDSSIRNLGFRIPMIAGYNFDFTDDVRIAPFTGPQLNFSFVSRFHSNEDELKNCNGSIFGEGGFKHFDLQWVFGVGVTYQKYYVSISGGVGMTRCMDLKNDHFRRNTFNISLGYNF